MDAIILLLSVMALCIALFNLGFLMALYKPKQEPKEISNEEKRRIEKEKRELMNFYTYNGDSQSR